MKYDVLEHFLEATKYKNMSSSDQQLGLPQPLLEQPFEGEVITLPDPFAVIVPAMDVKEAILKRESIRSYTDQPLRVEELSYVLYMTQGIRKQLKSATLRTVPSAGARHAFETYLFINHVEGLRSGLYRYIASTHSLGMVSFDSSMKENLLHACYDQQMIQQAALTFFWVCDFDRMGYRYQERGIRYLFLDAGHVSQNLYLLASQLHMGTCAIAAFDDDAVNKALGLDGLKIFTVYIGTLGKL
ncbi:MAG: SagB/ThcOx family dehydrogenase [Candidatus Izemoplasmatales bacterium]|jgi:SagB-type dehydrogenase family enzyme|nr:SagB/ThcOx family dehydrogenase [bacterium]MDZ4196782.1 SagB/ThcOx family dehydrogenase [Candidatus Izemoplasmatales bacterium]